MNINQRNYAKAKALFDTLKAEKDAFMKPHKHLLDRNASEADIEKYFEIETHWEFEHNYWNTFDLLTQAENAMIAWGRSIIESQFPARAKEVEKVWDSPLVSVRRKVVDLTFHLDAKR